MERFILSKAKPAGSSGWRLGVSGWMVLAGLLLITLGVVTVVVRAASKVPASKRNRRISRVDIYVNGRPVRSIDAADGTVPPTEVTIGKRGATRTLVDAQAWDQAGRLAAVRRMNIR